MVFKHLPGLPANFPAIAVIEPLMIILEIRGFFVVVVIFVFFGVVFFRRVVGFGVVALDAVVAGVVGLGGALSGSGHSTFGINLT